MYEEDAELENDLNSAGDDPMMIKEAVNSPRLQGEMNHSKHHYRLFWSNINSATQRSFDNVGLEIFAD